MTDIYKRLNGITTAIMTPMLDDGSFDEAGMGKLVDHVVSSGVAGVFALGVAGEYAVFNTETKKSIVKKVYSQVAGRTAVIVGVTGLSTQLVLENIEEYAAGNADYVLTTPPDFLEMTQDMCRDFILKVADSSPVPMVLYNCPLSRNYVSAEVMAEASKHPNMAAVKETSSMVQINDMREATLGRDDFTIMSGNEFIYYAALSMGYKSFIMGGPGNILPGHCVEIYKDYQEGRLDEALDKSTRMVKFLQELYFLPGGALIPGALAALKGVLSILGLCGTQVGHPNLPVSADQIKQIEKLMKKSGFFE